MPDIIDGSDLPVREALPALRDALESRGRAVLVAPPGAGKTTLVPLALLDAPWRDGKIVMLEPRRLAARAAAERMADLLGEKVGDAIGLRMRGETRVSASTIVEVVTEGVLTRMLQTDPSLEGISAVIFDEFHERSLNADLGLALTSEARDALRGDLRLLAMSATLDAGAVSGLLGDAPVVVSEGRLHAVEIRWLERPWRGPRGERLEDAAASTAREAHGAEGGDILVFLPGAAEIERVAARLGDLDGATDVRRLYGALSFDAQRAALRPSPPGRRKIVLATSIAETSLTVEGVRVVVDAGLARRSRYDPNSGMSRLVTERAAKAEATQRAGRAGRLEPGVCYRMWTKGEEGGLAPFAPPEIETADLAPFALEIANWGASPSDLALMTQPPEGALREAAGLLRLLGALDGEGRITAHGRALAKAPVHPRMAHMIAAADAEDRGVACVLAALLEDRDPLRGAGADLSLRMKALAAPGEREPSAGALRRLRKEAERLAKRFGCAPAFRSERLGGIAARAYPDRIAARRPGNEPRHLLSGGRGARLDASDPLANERFLVAADLDGEGRDARIRLAAPLSRASLEAVFGDELRWTETCAWSTRAERVEARRRLVLGAIALEDEKWIGAPAETVLGAMLHGVRALGLDALPWTQEARRLADRAEWARARGVEAPSLAAEDLAASLEEWLAPYLAGVDRREGLARLDLAAILEARLGWDGMTAIDAAAPDVFVAPTGTRCRIDYGGAAPSISVRLQEMFGLDDHPEAGGVPLAVELLSPARRPVQTTSDLPGFWRTSYADVRKDMRGRYPKHPWPEDPLAAIATTRAKPRR